MAIASMKAVVDALEANLAHWGEPVRSGTDIAPLWTWTHPTQPQEVKVYEVALAVQYRGPGAVLDAAGDKLTDPDRVLDLLGDVDCDFGYDDYDDSGGPDDRWKRRGRKAADKVAKVGARLIVIPAGGA